MKDKRRDGRLLEEDKVVLTRMTGEVRPGRPDVLHALTRDLSLSGLRVLAGAGLEAGGRVRVALTLGRTRQLVRAVAEVRWVREVSAGQVFEAGLEFVQLGPEDEFALMTHIFGGRGRASR